MANPDTDQANTRLLAFFHSLSAAQTERTQRVWSTLYKSAHSTRSEDVWADPVGYAVNAVAADVEAGTNPAVTKHTQLPMTEIPGSNAQAYYLEVAGQWIRPWISPRDIPDPVSNAPAYGYQAQLYQASLALITPTDGMWEIDYYAGIIHFFPGNTPVDLGWGIPRVTVYAYSGAFGAGAGTGADAIVTAEVDIQNLNNGLYIGNRFALVVVDEDGNVVTST